MAIKYKKIRAENVPLDTTQFSTGILLDENSVDVQKALKDINDNFEDTQVQVIDDLSSDSTSSALSANQGKVLSEALDDKEPANSNIVKDGSYVHTDNNYTDNNKGKVDYISVTQSVDLDAMESDISNNNNKISNVSTNLTNSTTENDIKIISSDGTDTTLIGASDTKAGIMTKTIYDEHVVNKNKVSAVNTTITLAGGTGLSGDDSFSLNQSGAKTITLNHDSHTGDVTGSTSLTIGNNKVTYAKIQDISSSQVLLGRNSDNAGDVEEITPAQIRTMINVEDGATADQTKSDIEGLNINASSLTEDSSNRLVTDTEKSTWNDKLSNSEVKDNVTSTDTDLPLSANQGKVLKGYIDTINGLLNSDDTTLDDLQEVVTYIKANKDTLDTLGISNIAGLSDALADKVIKNNDITAATKTKITYDKKGLITSATDATTADIADSTDRRYMTDDQETKLDGLVSDINHNVSTNLSNSTSETGINIISSDGDNTTLISASDTKAGIMTKVIYNEHIVNNDKVTNYNQTKTDIDALNIDADLLDGEHGTYYRNASNINAGTISDDRLPSSISSDITGNASTATTLTDLTSTVDELNYNDGVTSNIQTQLNNRTTKPADHTSNDTEYSPVWENNGGTLYTSTADLKYNPSLKRFSAGSFKSSVATGTAPFEVASTTKVTNLNADLLDGINSSSFLRSDADDTVGGNLLMATGKHFSANSDDSYDKLRVYNSSTYAIGMKSGLTYGGLNDWAMTFTMNNESDRGFLWRDSDDGSDDGAMSLTTAGELTVKSTINSNGDINLANNGDYSRAITFDGASDVGKDFAIRSKGETLEFYEPEDSNKVHMVIGDDTGVNAIYGLKENGTKLSDKYVLVPSGGTKGDILLHDGNGYKRLAKGDDDEILAVRNGEVVWDVPRL